MRSFIPTAQIPSFNPYNNPTSYPLGSGYYTPPPYPLYRKVGNGSLETGVDNLKGFYHEEFEKYKHTIMEQCQDIIKKELEMQNNTFQKEKDHLQRLLMEKEREIDLLRRNSHHESQLEYKNYNSRNSYDIHKSSKQFSSKDKQFKLGLNEHALSGLENKISGIEKSINDLKIGFYKKETKIAKKNTKEKIKIKEKDSSHDELEEKTHKLKKKLEEKKEAKKQLKKDIEHILQSFHGYHSLIRELDITSNNKNKAILQKVSEIYNNIKKFQKSLEKHNKKKN